LKSPNVETRRAAITAIVRLGTLETIQPLRSALGDPDQEVRFNSVLGLARVTGQTDWVPNRDVFMADEGKYLSHWK
jgi:HEAT repeat protein